MLHSNVKNNDNPVHYLHILYMLIRMCVIQVFLQDFLVARARSIYISLSTIRSEESPIKLRTFCRVFDSFVLLL